MSFPLPVSGSWPSFSGLSDRQFQGMILPTGDLQVSGGWVIAGRAGVSLQLAAGSAAENRQGVVFLGGSGRNIVLVDGIERIPAGHFQPSFPDHFQGVHVPLEVLVLPDGSAELRDDVNLIAVANPGDFSVAAGGVMVSANYGETEYNDGNPFTLTFEGEGALGTSPGCRVSVGTGTLPEQDFTALGDGSFEGETDADFLLTVFEDGTAELSDGTDVVAVRGAYLPAHEPGGLYEATSYGEATYNGGQPFNVSVVTLNAVPQDGWAWVVIHEATEGVPDEVAGPFYGVTVPTSSAPTFYVPIFQVLEGALVAMQDGPILWSGQEIPEPPALPPIQDQIAAAPAACRTALGLGDLATMGPGDGGVTGNVTLDGSAFGKTILCEGTGGYTVTLPGLAGNAGRMVALLGASALTSSVALDAGDALIDGEETMPLRARESLLLMCDGVGWVVLAHRSPGGDTLPVVSLTSDEYLALDPPDPDTIYDITDAL